MGPDKPEANAHEQQESCENRVSTNLTEQISRRFPGDSRMDFNKSKTCLHCFGLLCKVPNLLVCLNIQESRAVAGNPRDAAVIFDP